ncbi:protein kinase [candidate division GN15 bacterium]|nr:protein kinase [candidate division GN15 bacterium]
MNPGLAYCVLDCIPAGRTSANRTTPGQGTIHPFMTDSDHNNPQQNPDNPLAEGSLIKHYRIIRKIGEGGMGTVYLAQDEKLQRKVALKVLLGTIAEDPGRLDRFAREAKTAARISHANVMSIFDIDTVTDADGNERTFIVMEHIAGKALTDLLREKPPTVSEILRLAEKIATGMAAAHRLNIVHRDIKLDNIRLDDHDEPRILDFGLAKPVDPPLAPTPGEQTNTVSSELTAEGKILGTINYMSPEQARGEQVDHRSDIFSFGVLLYRMCTGKLPFEATDRVSTLAKILEVRHPRVREHNEALPAELERIIDKCLQKQPADRYQDTRDLVVDIRNLRREFESGITDTDSFIGSAPGARKRTGVFKSMNLLIAAVLVVAMVVVAINFLGDFGGSSDLQAAENRLAVMYFDNLTDASDSARLGEIITNLLITDLSASRRLQVVSSQRLYDELKQLGRQERKVVDRDVATQVANKVGARWMLMGSILQTEPQMVVTAQLVEVATGTVAGSQRFQSDSGQTIFSLVDQMSTTVRDDLAIQDDPAAASEMELADITTESPEAYRHYVEGLDLQRQFQHLRAADSFRRAVEADSAFAMAYYGLATTSPDYGERRRAVELAMANIDRAGERDQAHIRSVDYTMHHQTDSAIAILEESVEDYPDDKIAHYRLAQVYNQAGQIAEAIEGFEQAIAIDPLFGDAHNSLAYAYHKLGQHDKSLTAINRYIELHPDEANPYDSRGDLYAYNGQVDNAADSYATALEKDSLFLPSLEKLANMRMFQGRYDAADSIYRTIAAYPNKVVRADGRTMRSRVPLYRGRLREALHVLELGLETDDVEQVPEAIQQEKRRLRMMAYLEIGDYKSAAAEANLSVMATVREDPQHPMLGFLQGLEATFHAARGDSAKALAILSKLKRDSANLTAEQTVPMTLAQGMANFELGRFDIAANHFEKLVEREKSTFITLWLARCRLEAGNLGEAVELFEWCLGRYDEQRAELASYAARLHYWLGIAYEQSGWNDKAVEQYRTFLDIWKDADPDRQEVDDARTRLAGLTA